MNTLLRLELRKALVRNPLFWVAFFLGLGLAITNAVICIPRFEATLEYALAKWDVYDTEYSAATLYTVWMPLYTETWSVLFQRTWPLLAALPYAWAWLRDERVGLTEQYACRVGWRKLAASKLTTSFLVGGLTIAIPLVVNLIICACIVPATQPFVTDELSNGMTRGFFFSYLYYAKPLLFCLVWTCVAFVLAGLWASAVMALTVLADSFIPSFVGSYLLLHLLSQLGQTLNMLTLNPETDTFNRLLGMDVLELFRPGGWDTNRAIFALIYVGACIGMTLLGARLMSRGECAR